jgi:RHS repeat-associated protein
MNDKTENQNQTFQFLKSERGKTKSNAIEVPSIALPKGGGAIKGIDEKFSVNAVNGTAAFSIPLPVSPTRGASPALSLSYNSGSGNSIFGLGWNLSLPSIKRKTDKGWPQYLDTIDSDIFLFSGAEDLVPEYKKEIDGSFSKDNDDHYIVHEKDSPDGLYLIRFYRPRIEGLFARIERWTEKSNNIIKWRIITKDNVTTLFGWSSNSTIADSKDATRIFEWLPEFVFDDKGNCSQYIYMNEDKQGLDNSLLHNRNRLEGGSITYTNLYLEKVLYGNKTPYTKFGNPYPLEADYMFQTVLDYGEYDQNAPYHKIRAWDYRKDSFSDYKAGFEIRTTRLCRRVLLFHYFAELPGGFALIRSLNIEYDTTTEQDFTFLKSLTSFGYIKQASGAYTHKNLPSMEFEYQKHDWNQKVENITIENLIHSPSGLYEAEYQFNDLFNEGLSGILSEQANGWFYKHNLGDGRFEPAKLVTPKPSFSGLGKQLQLVDLDADGGKQLASFESGYQGYFELNDENEWQGFRTFEKLPNINFRAANIRMLDLNGDGSPDALITEDNIFTWYESAGRKGFSQGRKTIKPYNEEIGPSIVFADEKQTIFLADMSGDGMSDIVRIRNGEVCYWPNLGYGKFGAKVGMDNAPIFDHPETFNPAFLRLADIDGSGTTDILYLGKNKFSCWTNLSGNSFSITPFEIDSVPEIHNQASITVTDLLGNGVACIVWSSPLLKDANASLRFIDLMNSKKPHLMVFYKNNLGKEVFLEYTPSTKFYIEDKLTGKPWVTKLHFPVHCISKTETRDIVSGYRFVTSYTYHHGYYDHAEREFRGFGMVQQTDAEHFEYWVVGNASNIVDRELHQEPIITKNWFHTGAFLSADKILNQFSYEYWYEEMARHGFAAVSNEQLLPEARIITAPGIDATFIDHLSAEEWQQALRACKSMALRSEVFAKDAPLIGATNDQLKRELTPYSVAAHNCVIELVQPKGQNKYAIFVVKESESITYSYERNADDPRIAHNLNIRLDEYGNVLESVAIVYPRLLADASLPAETQQAQNHTTVIFTQNQFTNDVVTDNEYRLRLPSEVKTFELKGVSKTGSFYSPSDFDNILPSAGDALYHEVDKEPAPGTSQKRLIEHIRSVFYNNDLTGALPLNRLHSRALPYESYQLAYTPALIANIYDTKVNAALMLEGKFTHSEGDNNWWIRSGTIQFIGAAETLVGAQNRFFMPISYTDPYGAVTKVTYYGNYFLFVEETQDAIGNKTKVDRFNFRTLAPQRMKDVNNNLSEVLTDELGMVKVIAVFGKGNEADDLVGINEFTLAANQAQITAFFSSSDSALLTSRGKALLQHATTRFVYDFDAFRNLRKPAVVASITREEHFQKNNNSPVQITFEYSNGLGQVVMKKVQAEPGPAKQVTVNPDGTYLVTDIDTSTSNPKQLRWIGNGRTILNNKGNAVKQYEPYFSVTYLYEELKELVETGVTPILYYDAMGRLLKTEMPDGTFSKTEFDSWKQVIYDANDTVLESSWYINRTNRLIDAELIAEDKDPGREKLAADKAAKHANTPNVQHFDSLGRPVLSIDHNKNITTEADEFYLTKVHLDTEGNLRSVTDARGNVVMHFKYDMLGNKVYQSSMDAGQRWLLINVLSNSLRTWDERNHEFQYFYDTLHRPLLSKVIGGDGTSALDHIFERGFYGESQPNPELKNLRGQVFRHYDTGGLVETPEYDFKGQPKSTSRKLLKKYKETANWVDANLAVDLEAETFTFVTEMDALGRIARQTAPDGSVITPSYNEAGLLNSETVTHVSPSITTIYIQDIDYNEKGQRKKILYGNNVVTHFYYDRETFRLKRLVSKRQNNDPLQDWHYTFDPVGNITHIEDQNIPVVFFDNQKITSVSTYTYDALYRLVEATGRENNTALSFGSKDNWDDAAFMQNVNPGDPMAMRNYAQGYQYDGVGNIKQIRHQAAGNNWTRDYHYQSTNNRLVDTQVGANTYSYPHHSQHGFITSMPHLEDLGWNFKEELIKTIRQRRTDGGTPETTYYQYDGQGQRIRKITENQATAGIAPTKKEERVYIPGYEIFTKHSGADAGLERTSLSLMDKGHRFVIIETRNDVDDGTEKRLVRYQLHNHLGSANLELDSTNNARVISYEEYYPYGTTAYQAKNMAIKSSAKRYRYTGLERDEESGLEYHSARYYLSWLGRWISTDSIGIGDGVNVYRYVNNNPIQRVDLDGKETHILSATEMRQYSSAGQAFIRRVDQWLSPQIDTLTTQVANDRTRITSLQSTITAKQTGITGHDRDIAQARSQIQTLQRQHAPQSQISQLQSRLRTLRTERAALNAQLQTARTTLSTTQAHLTRISGTLTRLTDLRNDFRAALVSGIRHGTDSLILANVIFNEAGTQNRNAKLAVAYAYMNRYGGVSTPSGAAISSFRSLSARFDALGNDSGRMSFVRSMVEPLEVAAQRLNDTNSAAHDPTSGATHWVSPISLPSFDPANPRHVRERYSRTEGTAINRGFPNWARSNTDPQVPIMIRAHQLDANYSEIAVAGVSRESFLFYRGVH